MCLHKVLFCVLGNVFIYGHANDITHGFLHHTLLITADKQKQLCAANCWSRMCVSICIHRDVCEHVNSQSAVKYVFVSVINWIGIWDVERTDQKR